MSAKGAKTSDSSSESEQQSQPQQQKTEQAVKIKSEPIDLTETDSYKQLIEHEVNDLLAEKLSQLILDNKLTIDDFDDNLYGSFKKIDNVEDGLNILNDFEQANEDKLKDGRVNYLNDLIKKNEERINGETATTSLTPNGESSSSSNQSPAKTSSQSNQFHNSNSQNHLEELKKKCDEISKRTGKFVVCKQL